MDFSDVSMDRWSAGVIKIATDAGIMRGDPGGTFRPEDPCRREELAAVVAKLLWAQKKGLWTDLLPKVIPSVVLVMNGSGLGSGACVANKDGYSYIITNAHVVEDQTSGTLIKDDGQPNFLWELVAKSTDPDIDLALIRTTRNLPALPISTDILLGEPVAAIGAPLGHTEAVKVGIMSKMLMPGNVYELDVAINPGNSGGPVVDADGNIVAVVSSKIPAVQQGSGVWPVENIAYAIRPDVVVVFIGENLK